MFDFPRFPDELNTPYLFSGLVSSVKYFAEIGFLSLLIFLIPFITFSVIYWIVKNRWVFFPWQHNKPEEEKS